MGVQSRVTFLSLQPSTQHFPKALEVWCVVVRHQENHKQLTVGVDSF